ncbi:DNA cytosine methyltransferase [Myxococcus llanfairpwllgwyngyllgogerychwyrndrobwllllantysiliogogogochensis]|uniref:DNA cytosine methyltransferase n=1 Tax=Myxococcus llanfairpwllgwyngyllgogerychwyrndrobwllllantysiliogogogochensis TaxID=2590453 RepID=UPI001C66713F|nr:DNA cytosine methyltransferase [Myxococcus llanfairpwllgwyngyllgogerychwyrndrobwllllantysiliogogogochensis]
MSDRGIIIDLFAGGGGASTGLAAAVGRDPDVAMNHDPVAMAVYRANHTRTICLPEDVWTTPPRKVVRLVRRGTRVWILWASPDCTHFSKAKGGKPREKKLRSLAHVIVRYARDVEPEIICMENVEEFLDWGPLYEAGHVMPDGRVLQVGDKLINTPIPERAGEDFELWRGQLELLGYRLEWKILDASRFGAPTRRKRLFIVARRDGMPIQWPTPTHGPGLLALHTAAECLDWTIPVPSIFGRKRQLVPKTLWRVAQGVRKFVLETPTPFIVKVNHGGMEDRSESIDAPLSTVTASRRGHALVAAFLAKGYGGHASPGIRLDRPVDTITTQDHHALARVELCTAPLGHNRVAEVRAFLTTYYGGGSEGQRLDTPMRTITTKHRLGLVTVAGVDHTIVDIGLRMLEPHELLRAQFGRYADGYDLSAATSKAAKVRLIGNSVCPDVAEAVVRANVGAEVAGRRAA